jgi:hypothetical protein
MLAGIKFGEEKVFEVGFEGGVELMEILLDFLIQELRAEEDKVGIGADVDHVLCIREGIT